MVQEDARIPDLFIRGRATYSANLNAMNPIGTIQSIEHALRTLDKLATQEQNRVARVEKELADYRVQGDRAFEHEERLKQLLSRQAELNSLLDLDKGDQQGAAPATDGGDPEIERAGPGPSRGRDEVAKMAAAYMRASGTAIREMPISERTPPQTGQVTARVVAKNDTQIAFSTAANSYMLVSSSSLGRDVQIGERLSLRFNQGRALINNGHDRGR